MAKNTSHKKEGIAKKKKKQTKRIAKKNAKNNYVVTSGILIPLDLPSV